jgi:histidinol-phosphate aminotransferase
MNTQTSTLPTVNPLRPDVLAMQRYVVQPATGLIKLDAMENPYELPADLQLELSHRLASVALNRYPSTHTDVIAAIRAAQQIPAEYEMMLGNGSDEILHLLIQACATDNAVVMAPTPGFVMYAMSAHLNRCQFVGVPLQANFELDLPLMLAMIKQHTPAILFLANPNNPTGNEWCANSIKACIDTMQLHGGLVVIDEAYQPFANRSWLPRLSDAPNVVLVRTLSKLGLAGLRLGFLVAAPAWIEQFDKVRPPYNINVLTLAAAQCVLSHNAVLEQQAQEIMNQRTVLLSALNQMAQGEAIKPYPSAANFILLKVPDAALWFSALKSQGILVKNVSSLSPLLHNCLRLTVGSSTENAALIAALRVLAQRV